MPLSQRDILEHGHEAEIRILGFLTSWQIGRMDEVRRASAGYFLDDQHAARPQQGQRVNNCVILRIHGGLGCFWRWGWLPGLARSEART